MLKSCPGGRRKVKIPDSVKTIDSIAFCRSKIQKVSLGKYVTRIKNSAFCDCKYLTTIEWNTKLKRIDSSAFEKCNSLESITIPSNVRDIGGSAFSECKKLRTVRIPGDTLDMGEWAFDGCRNLRTVQIEGNPVLNIGQWAFNGCNDLEEFYMEKMDHLPETRVSDGESYPSLFDGTKPGIRFYVKDETMAAKVKGWLYYTGVTDANIYVGDKLIYEKVN